VEPGRVEPGHTGARKAATRHLAAWPHLATPVRYTRVRNLSVPVHLRAVFALDPRCKTFRA
jgi:hypothetical protein